MHSATQLSLSLLILFAVARPGFLHEMLHPLASSDSPLRLLLVASVMAQPQRDSPSYRHLPLDLGKRQIRLIKIHKNAISSDSDVEFDITTFDLADAPRYIALSYAWGDPSPTRIVRLNKQPYEIRKNLHDFLVFFKQVSPKDTHLWIDQISIDQTNLAERSHQVRQMRDVYKSCLCVISWLGCNNADVQAIRSYQETADLKQLEVLFSNPYFTRLWIVQEILLAPRLYLMCGDVWVSAPTMASLAEQCRWLEHLEVPLALFAEGCGILSSQPSPFEVLEECINRYSSNNCADLRDKVYGFLGLAESRSATFDHEMAIDYEKPIHDVFLAAVFAVSDHHREDYVKSLDSWRNYTFSDFIWKLGKNMHISNDATRRILELAWDWCYNVEETQVLATSWWGEEMQKVFDGTPLPSYSWPKV
jgi:hypothetical protein